MPRESTCIYQDLSETRPGLSNFVMNGKKKHHPQQRGWWHAAALSRVSHPGCAVFRGRLAGTGLEQTGEGIGLLVANGVGHL